MGYTISGQIGESRAGYGVTACLTTKKGERKSEFLIPLKGLALAAETVGINEIVLVRLVHQGLNHRLSSHFAPIVETISTACV